MLNPMVSVLMTSYNREKYISDAIKSVLASTYKNFELIIVDDCSNDATVEIAKYYASIDTRVKVFVNTRNLGDYPNRNQAAKYATGEYLKYVDADDLIYPWGLHLLVTMMEQFPQAGWGLCSLIQDKERLYPFCLNPDEAYRYHYNGPGLFHKAPLSSIIRSSLFHAIGGFSNLRMVGDFEMWHRLAQTSPVVLMPQGIVWYRVHGDQEMKSYKKFMASYEKIKIEFLNSPDCPLPKVESSIIISSQKKQITNRIIKEALKLNLKEIPFIIQQLQVYK